LITNKNKEMNKLIKPLAGLQPQIIQNWAIDKKKIIQGHYDRKISTFFESEDKNEQFQKLHQILVKWAILCGVKPLPLDEEMKLFVSYVAEHFHKMSLLEIDNAFNVATAGKLDIQADHYQSFSVIYIAKILNAYNSYKGNYILEYQRILKEKSEIKEPPTREERFQFLLEGVIENFEDYVEKRNYNHFGWVSYDFLDKLGIINIPNSEKEQILHKARSMAIGDARDDLRLAKDPQKLEIKNLIAHLMDDKRGKHQTIVRICKNLGLMVFYNNVIKNGFELKEEILKKQDNFNIESQD